MRGNNIYIIAEAGVNHNGSLELALQLVDIAADAGADAVKFQTFRAENVVCSHARRADYQMRNTGAGGTQLDMIRKLELDQEAHLALAQRCLERSIHFLSTPFDLGSTDFLVEGLRLGCLKISSGDLTNAPLLLRIASSGCDIILSTGMGTLGEIEAALGVLAFGLLTPHGSPSPEGFGAAFCSEAGQRVLKERVTLLHCTTEYPAPLEDVNLRSIDTLAAAFGLRVGYSDHTDGIAVSLAAAGRGACVIEKHFTLDRTLPGPDHAASLDPCGLCSLVSGIRQIEAALGRPEKYPAPSELKNREIARKSLVAARDIAEGDLFDEYNLTTKRPGNGESPMRYWEYLGTRARRSYRRDEFI